MLGAPPGPGNTMERPYIHELRIENYGCIRDATFRFTPLHALIGPNDSGKSTVLRALRTVAFTLDVAVDAPTPDFEERAKVYALGELWLSYANGEDEGPLLHGGPRP